MHLRKLSIMGKVLNSASRLAWMAKNGAHKVVLVGAESKGRADIT